MSLWKKNKMGEETAKAATPAATVPRIEQVVPRAAIPGGEVAIRGLGFTTNGNTRPVVRFGDQPAS